MVKTCFTCNLDIYLMYKCKKNAKIEKKFFRIFHPPATPRVPPNHTGQGSKLKNLARAPKMFDPKGYSCKIWGDLVHSSLLGCSAVSIKIFSHNDSSKLVYCDKLKFFYGNQKNGQYLVGNFRKKINFSGIRQVREKTGYTAQDAPSMRSKITRDGPTDGRTDGHNLLQRCDGASKNGYQRLISRKR